MYAGSCALWRAFSLSLTHTLATNFMQMCVQTLHIIIEKRNWEKTKAATAAAAKKYTQKQIASVDQRNKIILNN